MTRPWNFAAGPAVLPEPVLEQAASEMLDWQNTGMSVMEMSHRGPLFSQIIAQAEQNLRDLLALPDDFAAIFMQGGATGQNGILPLNLINRRPDSKADYVLTGRWSAKSFSEARSFGDMAVAATSGEATTIDGQQAAAWSWFPDVADWQLRPDASYLHFCTNETVGGVEWANWPELQRVRDLGVPVVIDASSQILSRPIDFNYVDVVYAGAQKNAGPAGVTLVLIRRDLLGHAHAMCPPAFNYEVVAEQHSMFNTPPTYAIYMTGLVLQWLVDQGGVAAMEAQNIAKAELLYGYLDSTDFYRCTVLPAYRSRMNVPFLLADDALDDIFLSESKQAGLLQLKGHHSVGGMRASMYNAMPIEGVQALVDFLKDFEARHG